MCYPMRMAGVSCVTYNVQVRTARLASVMFPFALSLSNLSHGATLDEAAAPGRNYAKAEFRLWYPDAAGPIRAVLVLVPGSNGDGRSMAEDPVWQAFAVKQKLALVGCHITDKPHDQNFLEDYANVSQGSGQALLDALTAFGSRASRPELGVAPLLLWGMSAGGQFNYEFVAWKPERVAAFVVNKGGIYYTALTSRASREVPGVLFIGGKDLESRIQTITGLFAVNRRAGALWALAEEPGAAHIVGRSRDLSMIFFEDVLPLRLSQTGALQPLATNSGFMGDPKSKDFHPVSAGAAPSYPNAWLPTERVARAWAAMLTERPFDSEPR
jgi:pimeloyl-ACP methyl ester carboxylesterase